MNKRRKKGRKEKLTKNTEYYCLLEINNINFIFIMQSASSELLSYRNAGMF
ncbi:MAG: hypothetical protein ACJ719_10055 [Nitrososphaeraceae archaeon]